MTLPLPKGFEIPEKAKPGEPFEVVATIFVNDDGTFSLNALDGMEISQPVEEEVSTSPNVRMPWDVEAESMPQPEASY